MASISVRVNMDAKALEECAYNDDKVKGEVTKGANSIAAKASSMATEKSGIWHETGRPHTPGREGGTWHGSKDNGTIGGVTPSYVAKPAKPSTNGVPVAIVVTANYAAQKDNMKHNTLVRAIG